MEEIWKPIQYEGYEVSNLGRIKSYKSDKVNGKILHPSACTKGYLQLDLRIGGRKYEKRVHLAVHRLVAEAFIPNPDNLPQVNHKDEDKTNNCVDNLEWCTNEYNARYGSHGKIKPKREGIPVYSVDEDNNIEYFPSIYSAANKNKGSTGQIIRVLQGKSKTAYGKKWFKQKSA